MFYTLDFAILIIINFHNLDLRLVLILIIIEFHVIRKTENLNGKNILMNKILFNEIVYFKVIGIVMSFKSTNTVTSIPLKAVLTKVKSSLFAHNLCLEIVYFLSKL